MTLPKKRSPKGKLFLFGPRSQPPSQPGLEVPTAFVPHYPRAALALPAAAPSANRFDSTEWQDPNKAAVKDK